MQLRTRDQHLFGPGPKRILALDGGGVRGILTLQYLKRLEALLRERSGHDPAFRLSQYFDLIGGTSTGSIIATGLALGWSVEKLETLYNELAEQVFQKSIWRHGILQAKFPRTPLMKALTAQFEDRTLGSEDLQTGLMIMTKRLDTGSPWPLMNNPKGRYFNPVAKKGQAVPNKDFLLREVVRASTAAPHYFNPERLKITSDADGTFIEGAFVDGGVSPHNNPALQMLLMATAEGFGLKWPTGADKLLLVSVGTGAQEVQMPAKDIMDMSSAKVALQALASLMNDCDAMNQTILQWMSRSPTTWKIDREVGDLHNDVLGGKEIMYYLRYNVVLDREWLQAHLKVDLKAREVKGLQEMDKPKNMSKLALLGATASQIQIRPDHFPAQFDI
ncbi:MAG: patatin-like phospholipase family protein [Nitrospirales bacterium]